MNMKLDVFEQIISPILSNVCALDWYQWAQATEAVAKIIFSLFYLHIDFLIHFYVMSQQTFNSMHSEGCSCLNPQGAISVEDFR